MVGTVGLSMPFSTHPPAVSYFADDSYEQGCAILWVTEHPLAEIFIL
jgi:hypothetical protein